VLSHAESQAKVEGFPDASSQAATELHCFSMSFYVFLSFLSAFQCHTKRHKDSGRAKSTSNAVDQSFLKNKELQQRFFHEEAYSGIPSGTVQ